MNKIDSEDWSWWPAPAKINLFLHIVGRRADGYHLLQTAFQFVDFCDQVGVCLRTDGEIRYQSPIPGVACEQDLVFRAARKLQEIAKIPVGVDLELRKSIPTGAGLGGGSSDAATTLAALNWLWQLGLSEDALADLGLSLGADVPVFVRGHAAWAEGVGELLTPIEPATPWYLILMPNVQVSTSEIFSHPELTRDTNLIRIRSSFTQLTKNDCLPLVLRSFPEVKRAFDWLAQYSEPRMSGTGAAIFAAFESADEARLRLAQLPENIRGFVAKGMNISPLKVSLAEKS